MIKWLVWTIWLFGLQAHASDTAALGLKEVFQSSLKNAETLPIQQSRTLQSAERVNQAKAGLLPNLTFAMSYLRQDTGTSDGTSAFTKADQTTTKATLTQPLFRGFREYAGIRATELDLKAQQAQEVQSRQALYKAVAQVFYAVLSANQDRQHIQTQVDLTAERVRELQSRSRIGRSRKGEVLAAQAQLELLKSQLEAATFELNQARDQFTIVTGLSNDLSLQDKIENLPSTLKPLEYYLSFLEKRGDLQALEAQRDSTQEKIGIAKGAHLPSIDLGGNYYFKRTGVLENSRWDIGLAFTLPLYQGGAIVSQVREATEHLNEQELLLAQGRRQAIQSIEGSHRLFSSSLAQIRALSEALTLAESNYREQTRDYRFGLVTNLDVLQALNSLQDTRRTLDRTRYQAKTAYASLEASIGSIP